MTTLQTHYLRLYKKADLLLSQPGNPCDIQMEGEMATCIMSRQRRVDSGTLCCTGCSHHSPKVGCTVKALDCKLGWCWVSSDHISVLPFNSHPIFAALRTLRREARELGIPLHGDRRSFEETFPERSKGK